MDLRAELARRSEASIGRFVRHASDGGESEIDGVAVVPSALLEVHPYRSTTMRLNANSGSEQSHATTSVIAWSQLRYARRGQTLRTAVFRLLQIWQRQDALWHRRERVFDIGFAMEDGPYPSPPSSA